LMDAKVKEANVAYDEPYLNDLIHKKGLQVEKTLYGHWSGRPQEEAYDFQDTLVLGREE